MDSKLVIAHIINPVNLGPSSDLHIAQPITFESMRRAKMYSQCIDSDLQIDLFTAQYPEDHKIIPDFFEKTRDLERSVLDVANFEKKRKLPLIKDILDRLYDSSNADYFIYTNVDIGLQPYFYYTVKLLIDKGYDAFIINRRTISNELNSINDLGLIYKELGEKHFGYDCFVFSKKSYEKFILKNICIGAGRIGRVLLWNLYSFSNRFKGLLDSHLTFHIGDDKVWSDNKLMDYFTHNVSEATKIHSILKESKEIKSKESFTNDVLCEKIRKELMGEMIIPKRGQKNLSFFKNLFR